MCTSFSAFSFVVLRPLSVNYLLFFLFKSIFQLSTYHISTFEIKRWCGVIGWACIQKLAEPNVSIVGEFFFLICSLRPPTSHATNVVADVYNAICDECEGKTHLSNSLKVMTAVIVTFKLSLRRLLCFV